MGRCHPIELRERVVNYVEAGHSHRASADRFQVSVKFVNDMVKLKRETGSLSPKRQGNPGIGKLSGCEDFVREQLESQGDLTLDQLVGLLREECGVQVHRSSVGRLLRRLGLTHKKRFAGLRATAP